FFDRLGDIGFGKSGLRFDQLFFGIFDFFRPAGFCLEEKDDGSNITITNLPHQVSGDHGDLFGLPPFESCPKVGAVAHVAMHAVTREAIKIPHLLNGQQTGELFELDQVNVF
ncbi:hypothetical protein, partial [Thiolapillus sp.]|uniref:hypothetical protein n=1 Tax=Thiolapillus sp. TaxID=2017437 RepID=UPI003AF5CC97